VTVAVNYRLGAMGFLHLPGQASTNRALRDIIQALEWVRDEISSFGGDRHDVTVYGQSSGSLYTHTRTYIHTHIHTHTRTPHTHTHTHTHI
jgi:para-nitrobenzyl esterase